MKDFFKILAANITALVVVAGVMMAGMAFLTVTWVASARQSIGPAITPGGFLVLDLRMSITDAPRESTPADLLMELQRGPGVPTIGLFELTQTLRAAARDPRVTGLYLHEGFVADGLSNGYAALREVKDAIESFRREGKPVVAYLVNPSIKDYYLASSADTIVINPYGQIALNGLASTSIFFGDALKKYGIGVQVTKVGRFKSATDMFTANEMSEDDRAQLDRLLEDLWTEILVEVALRRPRSLPDLRELSAEKGFLRAEEAFKAGLVDDILYLDEMIEHMAERGRWDYNYDTFAQTGFQTYLQHYRTQHRDTYKPAPYVAVVYAEGEIVDGEAAFNFVGGDTLSRFLRELRQDDDVVAVVLRVNSPGGSVLASEKIQREMRLLRDEKPVIVSMGAFAASGGYWISAYADTIFAEPETITGSIGVFGLLFNVEELAGRHGITFDGVQTAPLASIFSIARPRTEKEMAIIQSYTDFYYEEFITKVAEGRNMPRAEVEALAQGQVWSGISAHRLGLVDHLGGLRDAIDFARREAGLGERGWSVIEVPRPRDLSEQLAALFSKGTTEYPVAQQQPPLLPRSLLPWSRLADIADGMAAWNDPQGVYARLPFRWWVE